MHEILSAIKSVMADDAVLPTRIVEQGRASPRRPGRQEDPTVTPQPHMELDRDEVALWMGHPPPAARTARDGGAAPATANQRHAERVELLESEVASLEAQNKELRSLLEDAEVALRRSAHPVAAARPEPVAAAAPAAANPTETLVGQLVSMAQLLGQTCELNVELQRQLARQTGEASAADSRAEALHSICEIVDRLKGHENK